VGAKGWGFGLTRLGERTTVEKVYCKSWLRFNIKYLHLWNTFGYKWHNVIGFHLYNQALGLFQSLIYWVINKFINRSFCLCSLVLCRINCTDVLGGMLVVLFISEIIEWKREALVLSANGICRLCAVASDQIQC